jgi:hypothetical protein
VEHCFAYHPVGMKTFKNKLVEAFFVSDLPKLVGSSLDLRFAYVTANYPNPTCPNLHLKSASIAWNCSTTKAEVDLYYFGVYMSSNSNNITSTPTILGTMEGLTPTKSTTMVTAPAAQFLGSFAADSRYDHRKHPAKQDIKSLVHHYFTEGWRDISIWKSAVSANSLSEWRTPVPEMDKCRWFKIPQFSIEEPHSLKRYPRLFLETNFYHKSLLSL